VALEACSQGFDIGWKKTGGGLSEVKPRLCLEQSGGHVFESGNGCETTHLLVDRLIAGWQCP
jgi:hypothetical protein